MWKLKEEYHVEISNSFVAVKSIKESVEVHMASKRVRILKPQSSIVQDTR
jgi:hypothetical protein